MIIAHIANHYWLVGGSDIYSSATNTLVADDDPNYVAWTGSGRTATPIANEAELAEVLRNHGAGLPAWLFTAPSFIQPAEGEYDNDQLKAYSADARWRKQQGGIVVNGISFPTDPVTLGSLNSAYIYVQSKGQSTFSWKLPDGSFITLNTAQIAELQSAVSKYGQDCFACEDANVDKIDAGTMTDLPAIDATYAAVSNSFTGTVTRRK